jgi:hypothetical protein
MLLDLQSCTMEAMEIMKRGRLWMSLVAARIAPVPMFQTPEEQTETLRWAVLATHLNGAADSGKYDHIDTNVVLKHVSDGDVFEFLRTELGEDVEYALNKLTDVHRHMLLQHWRTMATGYETYQFHVRRSGLALLVAYLLHLIQNRHVQIPK